MVNYRKNMVKLLRLNLSALLTFFCLFTLSVSASSFNTNVNNITNDTDRYFLSENNHSAPHTDSHYSDFLQDPFQSPAAPIPTPSEPNEKDNKENQHDDEWSSLHYRFYGDFDFVFESSDVSSAQFEQNVLKRTKISLVVLHHAWKSFLP
jgi:hypothetical protein